MTRYLRTNSVRILLALAIGLAIGLLGGSSRVRADGSWLDQPLTNWNQAGMEIPAPPAASEQAGNPQCLQTVRPPQTAEDNAVVAAGWMLVGSYQGGWGVTILTATSDFDGMCRPLGYQVFVFADGAFAGTISPEAMSDRFDGAGRVDQLAGPFLRNSAAPEITAEFSRYTPTDALCCPSAISTVTYSVDSGANGPVLTPHDVSTNPTSSP